MYFFLSVQQLRIIFYFHFAGCCGTFCGLCLVCQNANGMQKSGILYGLLTCIMPCIPILLLRQEARDKYQIEVTFHNRSLSKIVIQILGTILKKAHTYLFC